LQGSSDDKCKSPQKGITTITAATASVVVILEGKKKSTYNETVNVTFLLALLILL
jgi:cobalamin biosynthesis protein CbiD